MIFILQKIIETFTGKRKRRAIPAAAKTLLPDFIQYYNDDGRLTDRFLPNLAKTISWTQAIVDAIQDTDRLDYLRVFRITNPIYEGKPFYTFNENSWTASTPNIPFNYEAVLSKALTMRPDNDSGFKDIANLGKILRFEIDVTTNDGAPAAELGFVDESDIPPIDTWFYVTRKYLYCWIPTLFIGKMQDAIDVEILGSYEWLEKLDSSLNHEIEEKMKTNSMR